MLWSHLAVGIIAVVGKSKLVAPVARVEHPLLVEVEEVRVVDLVVDETAPVSLVLCRHRARERVQGLGVQGPGVEGPAPLLRGVEEVRVIDLVVNVTVSV